MNINWKYVSKSKGYKSLKSAYIKDVQEENSRVLRRKMYKFRSKEEHRKFFKNAIALAMKYSYKWNMPIDKVLAYWELKRDYYYWLNFYQEHRVSKLKPGL